SASSASSWPGSRRRREGAGLPNAPPPPLRGRAGEGGVAGARYRQGWPQPRSSRLILAGIVRPNTPSPTLPREGGGGSVLAPMGIRAAAPMTSTRPLPPWADYALLPLLNLAAALGLSGLVILAVGENPLTALKTLIDGVVGDPEGIGFTLYYATTFALTGLAVAIPFHAGLFNIGGEGQAMLGGLGVALVCLGLPDWPLVLVLPLAVAAAAACGAAWAFVPAWLQARRGSHIVITTIMFNFIAATLFTWLLIEVLIA